MTTPIKYETELIIGADPSAFIEKVESVYLLDVRAVSKCPVESIEFSSYKIRADVEFWNQLEAGSKSVGKGLIESVKKVIIEDDISKVSSSIDNFYGVLLNTFSCLISLELELAGKEIKPDQLVDILGNSNVSKVNFNGLESDGLMKIEAKKIQFCLMSPTQTIFLIGEDFQLEFNEKDCIKDKDFVVISPSNLNIKVNNLVHGKTSELYDKFDSTKLNNLSFVFYNKHIHTLSFGDVPSVVPKVIPINLLKLYISEKNDFSVLNTYLDEISDTLPIFTELDLSFLDDLEATQDLISKLFTKNVVKVDIVMELQNENFITHLYTIIKQSKSVKSVALIVNQDPTLVIDLIESAPRVEQWIMDLRKPWGEKEAELLNLLRNTKDNSIVLRDVNETFLECRYPTSFEIRPVL